MNGVEGRCDVDRTELLESALDSLTEGVALADEGGRVALWNRAAETISGFASERLWDIACARCWT
jgi:PAS domain S-box-containing protein